MLLFALGMAVVLAVIGVACYVMTTNRLPFGRRTVATHRCPQCGRRFDSVTAELVHEIQTHPNG